MSELLRRMWSADDGQDLLEYALLLTLISIALITALTAIGNTLSGMFGALSAAF